MAKDIAFALGVLALLGQRVPLALEVFLTALAVIDDVGAVLVIGFFSTPSVSWAALAAAAACLASVIAANRLRVRTFLVYGGRESACGWPSCCRASTPRSPGCS